MKKRKMNVWLAVWENRLPEVYLTYADLYQALLNDVASGYFDTKDIEYEGDPINSVYVDEWLSAREVEVIQA